jgi:GNAT superfamily N-acetyltransferase
MKILDFDKNHMESAIEIALMNYNEERSVVTELPLFNEIPDLENFKKQFADNGLGVAMFDGDKMLGFLCCYKPWDNAFDSTARGTFSPLQANGAVSENRAVIYKKLYQAAAEKWVKHKITYHSIALYAHDTQTINALFTYGFGLRCIDAIRPMTNFEYAPNNGVDFCEIHKADVEIIRDMRKLHVVHMGNSPIFMWSTEKAQNWIAHVEKRDSRLFIAKQADKPIAYLEIVDNGENFVTESSNMKNICGAFCLQAYRGKGIMQELLNYAVSELKTEGYNSLGVDFESFNPTANGFWLKHFTAYTKSVTRRIDECAL